MNTGMLWFDNSKDSLEVKVKKALDYYVKKYNQVPNLVLVHPNMLINDMKIEASFMSDKIMVRPYRPVLPGHIWIGMEDEKEGGDNGKKETT